MALEDTQNCHSALHFRILYWPFLSLVQMAEKPRDLVNRDLDKNSECVKEKLHAIT